MTQPRIEHLPHYGYADYLQWEGRWELIAGIPYAMTPSPGIRHQAVSHNIAWQLQERLADCPHCRPLLPVDWKVDDDTVVQPDNLVVCGQVQGAYLTRAPVLIVEVLSKSTAAKDKGAKFSLYEKEGVRWYVLVDPEERIANVYHLRQGRYAKVMDARDDHCEFDLGDCCMRLDFSKVWA